MRILRCLSVSLAFLLVPLATTASEPRRLPTPEVKVVSYVDTATYKPYESVDLYAPPRYELGAKFDKGIFIRGTDPKKDPFSIYIGARMGLRHSGFARSESTWTDSAGVTRTIRNRNQFESERLRLNISGTAISEDLTYYIIFDGDSDGASNVDQLAYIFTYQFDKAFKVRLGRWKVAAHREWLTSSRHFQMVDRAMATEFFRGGYSDGIWVLGDLGETWHYESSLTSGLRNSTRRSLSLDDNVAFAATAYTDPLGAYGQGEADYAWHCSPVIRFGGSFAIDKTSDRSDIGLPLGDDDFLRLTNGTRLADVGSLAPGVQVLADRTLVGTIDCGIKYAGWSLVGEYFVRSIQDITADGAIPVTKLNAHGFRATAGKFIVPQRLDVNLHTSQVSGLFGDGFEYATGFNWYWGKNRTKGKLDDRVNKFSFDVSRIKGAPTTSGPADLVVGDDGWLFRTQMQIAF